MSLVTRKSFWHREIRIAVYYYFAFSNVVLYFGDGEGKEKGNTKNSK